MTPRFASLFLALALTLFAGSLFAQTTNFRLSSATIRSPHLFTDPPLFDCKDVTYDGVLGFNSANETIADSLKSDDDQDTFVDFALLFELSEEEIRVGDGKCSTFADTCEPNYRNDPSPLTEKREGDCYSPATDARFQPTADTVEAPCFVSDGGNALTLDVGKSTVTFSDTTLNIAQDDDRLSGVMVGFLSEERARKTEVRGGTLFELLPGPGNCSGIDGRGESNGEMGWWFTIEFEARETELASSNGGCATVGEVPSASLIVWILAIVSFRRRSRAHPT